MLAFFDFYPVISKADSFLDLYSEAFGWAMWNLWNPFLVVTSLVLSFFLVRVISLNTLSWTFFLSFSSLFILGLGEYFFREQFDLLRGAGKLSDQLLFITESVMVLWAITIPLLVASLIFRNRQHSSSPLPFGLRFQSLSKWRQRVLLTLLATSLFSYPFLHFPLLILTLAALLNLWLKNVQINPRHQESKWSDLIPVGTVALLMLALSWMNVEEVVHSIPYFKTYF